MNIDTEFTEEITRDIDSILAQKDYAGYATTIEIEKELKDTYAWVSLGMFFPEELKGGKYTPEGARIEKSEYGLIYLIKEQ